MTDHRRAELGDDAKEYLALLKSIPDKEPCGVEPTPAEAKAKQDALALLFVNGSGNPAAEQAATAARSKALTDWAAGKSDKAEADTLRLRKAGDEVFCFFRKHIAEDVWSVIESDGDYTAAFESHKGRPNGYLLLQIIKRRCVVLAGPEPYLWPSEPF